MGAVDRVARLEANDRAPAALGEGAPAGGRGVGQIGKQVARRLQQPDLAAEQHRPLPVEPRDAGVGRVGRPIDQLGLAPLVVVVALT